MENMAIYEASREVPQEACKQIQGGRLKGFTDINPMWRIKKLTELFGVCGIGWYYEVTEKRFETGADGEVAAFVDIALYIKVDGEWSKPIHGTGGSSFIAKDKNGMRTSDEAFKMATTDALSVACKNLGFGASIYWSQDKTKYTSPAPEHKQESKGEVEDQMEVAELKAKIIRFVNKRKWDSEMVAKYARHLGKESIKDFGMEECLRFKAIIEKKGASLDE